MMMYACRHVNATMSYQTFGQNIGVFVVVLVFVFVCFFFNLEKLQIKTNKDLVQI